MCVVFDGRTEAPIKRATVLGSSKKFSNTLTQYCSSAYWLQSDREKLHFLSISAVPNAMPNSGGGGCVSVAGHRGFWEEV